MRPSSRLSSDIVKDPAAVVYHAVRQRLLMLRDIVTGKELEPQPAVEQFEERSNDFYRERMAK